jgi:DNA-binding NarL/FixJ family response regulator
VTVTSPRPDVKGISLYSLNKSLQTGLLASLISEKTQLACNVITEVTPDATAAHLLLIDCQGLSSDALRELVSEIHAHEQPLNAALLNAQYNSDHEELLDWPCISGLFFVDTDQEQLIRGLECLLLGEYWVPRRLLHHFLEKNRRAPSIKHTDINLTRRERQILKLIKDGATNMDISDSLTLSEHTVKSHLYNVYKKIGVRNRLEASNWVRDMDEL